MSVLMYSIIKSAFTQIIKLELQIKSEIDIILCTVCM